jgi:hypothetical protein
MFVAVTAIEVDVAHVDIFSCLTTNISHMACARGQQATLNFVACHFILSDVGHKFNSLPPGTSFLHANGFASSTR